MTTTDWILVVTALIGGLAAGLIAQRVIHHVVTAPSRPEPVREAARPLANLGLSVAVVVGMVIALGVVSPSALDQLPRDVVDFLPRLLSAAIIVILANVLSSFAQTALARALARLQGSVRRQVLAITRFLIITVAVLLAVRQLGIDTTVLNLALAAVFFGTAGALMLLIALGGRGVAVEVASTRALRRLLSEGDQVEMGPVRGTVAALHPTAVELTTADGRTVLVPASHLVAEIVTVDRGHGPARPPASTAAPTSTAAPASTTPRPEAGS
jgi:small-conductance mechanosensitive channel